MTSYSPAEAASLDETREHIATFYGGLLRAGAHVEVIATALAGESDLTGTLHECQSPRCDRLTDTPVRDPIAVSWVGDAADTFCDDECMSDASEAYWTERWAV